MLGPSAGRSIEDARYIVACRLSRASSEKGRPRGCGTGLFEPYAMISSPMSSRSPAGVHDGGGAFPPPRRAPRRKRSARAAEDRLRTWREPLPRLRGAAGVHGAGAPELPVPARLRLPERPEPPGGPALPAVPAAAGTRGERHDLRHPAHKARDCRDPRCSGHYRHGRRDRHGHNGRYCPHSHCHCCASADARRHTGRAVVQTAGYRSRLHTGDCHGPGDPACPGCRSGHHYSHCRSTGAVRPGVNWSIVGETPVTPPARLAPAPCPIPR